MRTVSAVLTLDDARPVERWASLSEDGVYRYDLGRRWGDGGHRLLWVMLNPSTADAHLDDPTIRRCTGFAKGWDYDEMVVVNLCAFRATDPAELGRAGDAFGPENSRFIDLHTADAEAVVAAWGAHPWASQVADSTLAGHRPLYCLGRTKAGHPRHPLYVRADQSLEVWRDA